MTPPLEGGPDPQFEDHFLLRTREICRKRASEHISFTSKNCGYDLLRPEILDPSASCVIRSSAPIWPFWKPLLAMTADARVPVSTEVLLLLYDSEATPPLFCMTDGREVEEGIGVSPAETPPSPPLLIRLGWKRCQLFTCNSSYSSETNSSTYEELQCPDLSIWLRTTAMDGGSPEV